MISEADNSAADGAQNAVAQTRFLEGWGFHQKGEFARAEEKYRQTLDLQPRHFDALHLRGILAVQKAAFAEAVAWIEKAIAVAPANATARFNLGVALEKQGQLQAAADSFGAAAELRADYADASYQRGNALRMLGQHGAAITAYDKALQIKPGHADAFIDRGISLWQLGQAEAAVESYDQALRLRPGSVEALINRGVALRALNRLPEAIAGFNQAIAQKSEHYGVYINRGAALTDLGDHTAALADFDKAIQLRPDNANAHLNRGVALADLGRNEAALASFDKAIQLNPAHVDAHFNRGGALVDLGRRAEALQSYEKALALDPLNADAHWNMCLCRLQVGDFERGWVGHEWRWKVQKQPLVSRSFVQPLWLGDRPVRGKTILLYADQGLGDTLQFCRYASLLRERGAAVILEVPKALVSFLTGLDGVARVVAFGDDLPTFDLQCPLGSLALAFKTDAGNIPKPGGYLQASGKAREGWRARLGPKTGPRVGLVWSGNTRHRNDRNRSIPLADFVKMLPPGLDYISLQKEVRREDQDVLRTRPDIRQFGENLADFSDTAALCDLVDVIVSVDTSVAHLAGAMGRPVWIVLPFNPDWRWMLERSDSPWYAAARLYRQRRLGDWSVVFNEVKADLRGLSAASFAD